MLVFSFPFRNPCLLLPLSAAARIARAPMSTSPAASATKATVSVEYAKSGRSACKGCSASIAKGALRLGASARDPRGFDATKWYHVACFPASSHPLGPVENVEGFDSIKDDDREELRELEKNNKRDQTTLSPLEVPSPKKAKADKSLPEAGFEESASISVEYAKSGRSTCKGCSASIVKGVLRLGTSAHDPRGFKSTKWYHIACFPVSSHPLGPVENVKGFDSIKDDDREELRELEKNSKKNQTAVDPLEVSSPTKAKAHLSSNVVAVTEKASISVEYAKSGRSTCKGCSASIDKGVFRLGASTVDPRGFDSTKWYHVACFPASSHPIGPIEKVKGFDSIKEDDREELRELEKDGNFGQDHVQFHEIYSSQNNKIDQPLLGQLEVPSSKKPNDHISSPEVVVGEKLSPGKRNGPVISFSASDIKTTYKDATLPAHWKVFDTVIFREQDDGLHASAKIAAFDFDGCLAKTSVKSIGADKWSLQHKSIPEKLQRLYSDGYKLVIFTNESNIERWKNKRQQAVDSKVGRLDNFIECVKVPIQVFIACGLGKGKGTPDDPYRKPNSGMWWLMAEHFNSGMTIDMDQSFYVGDAAGRENDHSDADIEFAKAIGLKFHVPEEYFSF